MNLDDRSFMKANTESEREARGDVVKGVRDPPMVFEMSVISLSMFSFNNKSSHRNHLFVYSTGIRLHYENVARFVFN